MMQRMEDTGELTFQTRTNPRLTRALVRRSVLPIASGIAVVMVVVAALLYRAGDPGGWAVSVLGGAAIGTVFMLFVLPHEVVKRDAHKVSGPIGYRIDAGGVHTAHGFSTDTLPWSAIRSVRRARGQILLTHHSLSDHKRRTSSIPTADLTAAEQARLWEVLRSRGAALTNEPAG
jgi:hypothetical protein